MRNLPSFSSILGTENDSAFRRRILQLMDQGLITNIKQLEQHAEQVLLGYGADLARRGITDVKGLAHAITGEINMAYEKGLQGVQESEIYDIGQESLGTWQRLWNDPLGTITGRDPNYHQHLARLAHGIRHHSTSFTNLPWCTETLTASFKQAMHPQVLLLLLLQKLPQLEQIQDQVLQQQLERLVETQQSMDVKRRLF